jgi:hypothetical protein
MLEKMFLSRPRQGDREKLAEKFFCKPSVF